MKFIKYLKKFILVLDKIYVEPYTVQRFDKKTNKVVIHIIPTCPEGFIYTICS